LNTTKTHTVLGICDLSFVEQSKHICLFWWSQINVCDKGPRRQTHTMGSV